MVSSGLKVERTYDYKTIRELALDPHVYKHVSDDYSSRDSWQVPEGAQYVYLLASDDSHALGFAAFLPRNRVMCEAHICFLPRAYGERAQMAFRAMLDWVWRNTQYKRIVGEIPISNRRALAFVRKAGVEAYGINKASKMRNGILEDQVALGISCPL